MTEDSLHNKAELAETQITDRALEATDASNEWDDHPRPSRAHVAILTSARIVTGLIGVAIAGALLAAAIFVPFPTHVVSAPAVTVTPSASAQKRVCAGPLVSLGDVSGRGASVLSSIGTEAVTHGQTSGTASLTRLRATENASKIAPYLARLAPSTSTPPALVSASQSEIGSTDAVVGLAAAECREASSDSWLVGGSTTTGRTTIISLTNPSAVPATVDLSIYSETGLVSAPGTTGITVAPGSQRLFSLAAFAPSIASPVVHVLSRGGIIMATLQQSTVRTLQAGGVDFVGSSAALSTSATIPGLTILNSEGLVGLESSPGNSDLSTVIRLFVPGSNDASASISLQPEQGVGLAAGVGTTVKVQVKAGMVTDVPLDAFADGSYTVTITSTQPLVAGSRVSTVGSLGQTDFAWYGSGATLEKQALVSVASAGTPQVHLVNPTTEPQTVVITTAGAAFGTVTVPAGKTMAYALTASPVPYLLSGFRSIIATVSYNGDGLNSAYTVTPRPEPDTAITIHP